MYGGGVIFSNKATRSTFKQQCQYLQASQPMVIAGGLPLIFFFHPCALYYNQSWADHHAALQVWKYQATTLVADKALEQLNTMVQTPQGLRESRMLVTGSMNGSIR
jgi:WD repeat-containing protein 21A